MISTENFQRVYEMSRMGYAVFQNEYYVAVSRNNANASLFLLATQDPNLQIEEAWKFVEKYEAYIMNAPSCHHAIVK